MSEELAQRAGSSLRRAIDDLTSAVIAHVLVVFFRALVLLNRYLDSIQCVLLLFLAFFKSFLCVCYNTVFFFFL